MKSSCLLLLTVPCCLGFQATRPVMRMTTAQHLDVMDAALFTKPNAAVVQQQQQHQQDSSSTSSTEKLPPVLQEIVDERARFQRDLGKAMDTLRKDYPDILTRAPEFSIYHDNLCVVDPSGVQLSGLYTYKNAFRVMQTLLGFLYHIPRSSKIQYRMAYDFLTSSIRVSWHLQLHPKIGFATTHVDGISVYRLDAKSGKIVEHKVENLVINNTPVAPPYGMFSLIQEEELARGVALPC